MSVLVFVENNGGKFRKSAFDVVSYARAVADQLATELYTLSIGPVDNDELHKLSTYGAATIISAGGNSFEKFDTQAYTEAIAQTIAKYSADVLILANSLGGRGLAARCAVKLRAGLVDGAISLPEIDSEGFRVKRSAFSGKAIATVSLKSAIKIISLAPNSFPASERVETPVMENFSPEWTPSNALTVEAIEKTTNKIPLPEAERVVSGGRGLKGPENWAIIEELAQALNAATACSKPVSDAGWRPHEEHVGQTGIAVSPNLYIAIGISGAIQHLAGVSSSKTIVVINKDPEAPFFKVADYGIVGDAFEVVPKLTEAINAYKANS